MIKKIALGIVVLLLVAGIGLFFWAQAVLSTDTVRSALAAQLSQALGQPVTVDAVSAGIYPRVTVTLKGVSIGQPTRIKVGSLDVGTDFRALLSRRIEHAALHINEARLELPLPPMKITEGTTGGSSGVSGAPVELVSIDEVQLKEIELVSRGRTLRGDIDLIPHGTSAVTIRKIALTADTAHIDGTGEITDLSGPVGTIDLKATALDLDQLTMFASDFVEGSTTTGGSTGATKPADAGAKTSPSRLDLTVSVAADRATMAGVTLDSVSGRAHLKGDSLNVDPMKFNLFGGSYTGQIRATLGDTPTFGWKAALANVDVAAVTAFVGNPGVLTGRLAGQVDLTGAGLDAASAMKTARGTAKVTIINGVVKNRALVRSAVAATSLDPQAVVASMQGSHDEPFTELGASLSIFSGSASTPDLHFISKDLRLDAGGALKLDGSALNLKGAIEMSEELSKQASNTVVRATAQNGKITLPITITGVAGKYSIQIDTASLARRAITSEAKTQAQEALKKGLGRIFR
jgi:uncharacterized protein involved in outer membrane biogenesis